MNVTQQRFKGYVNTKSLWEEEFFGIQQFQMRSSRASIDKKITDTIRLGNYVEKLVSYELSKSPEIEILKENIQVIKNKQTLGEIDCLLKQRDSFIHLEIAYKFYLYDESVGHSFLDHWIGPNRRDSLLLKLSKLKNKQFPLLFNGATEPYLDQFELSPSQIYQKALFKAQLFLPVDAENINFENLNEDCVRGVYTNLSGLERFSKAKFYIPKKLDWLIEPHYQVNWKSYALIVAEIQEFFKRNSSPLIWMKMTNGELKKLFVTWW